MFVYPALAKSSEQDGRGQVKVAVASNFLATLKLLQPVFEAQANASLVISAGSTGKLYSQIIHGAPYDVFLAADSARPQRLKQRSQRPFASPFTYAVGRLAIFHPEIPVEQFSLEKLTTEQIRFVALANPKTAPYGVAATQWLQANDLHHRLKTKLVTGENVGQVLQFVSTGNAQIGLVSLSLLKHLRNTDYTLVSELDYQPIKQQGIGLNQNPTTLAFTTFLLSLEAQQIIQASGYHLP
ncbi:molybdate ABC transporter substrate-binding protein [Aliiglaciecola sp. LCG003]|uniref:molybdate ABC transporter substrate-binding protein n=1 Tax=Aliiglaciecola sp. LCG003 TaxID=3053655 RepID=UPI00257235E6|nr:molybdate ABC transporter substrate-binding protein [Aliiglaciecola sp. LCG003]WJG10909.1 molybdate ABC transporter substrate-binding protein [Aliiglaciecola sp. LCG003]